MTDLAMVAILIDEEEEETKVKILGTRNLKKKIVSVYRWIFHSLPTARRSRGQFF